jgi:hypothetical protein
MISYLGGFSHIILDLLIYLVENLKLGAGLVNIS